MEFRMAFRSVRSPRLFAWGVAAWSTLILLPGSLVAQRASAVISPDASLPERATFMATAEQRVAGRIAAHRYLVVFRESGGRAGLRADEALPVVRPQVIRAAGARIGTMPGVRSVRTVGNWSLAVVEVDGAEAAVALLSDPNVAAVEQDEWHVLQDSRGSEASLAEVRASIGLAQSTPWGVAMVGAPAAWAAGARGQGIKVGLLDSGGDVDHPDLVWAGGYDATGLSTTPTLPSAWDDNISYCKGHGTHVAGTVGARDNTIGVVGVAPEAELYAVKVFQNINSSCGAWTSSQINGLNWMAAQGVRIASVSIGGTHNLSYSLAVRTLLDNGLVVVGSSGNDNMNAMRCPACYNSAIAVGAITSSKTRASYSNYGYGLTLVAPGSGVSSTMPGGGTGSKSGTSMAAPHVAGVLALVLSRSPGISVTEALNRVGATVEDLGSLGWDNATGAGMARADLAVAAPQASGVTVSSDLASVRLQAVAGAAWTTSVQQRLRIVLGGPEGMGTRWFISPTTGVVSVSLPSPSDPFLGTASPLILTGSGSINATTPIGVYHDTLVVRHAGTGDVLLRVPVEVVVAPSGTTALAAAVSPGIQFSSLRADSVAAPGAAQLTLSGTGASAASWVVEGGRWVVPSTPAGVGSGAINWVRQTSGLLPGVHVDTLWVDITGPQGVLRRSIIDSLLLRAAPVTEPTVLTVEPSEFVRALASGAVAADSFRVVLAGPLASTTSWNVATTSSKVVLASASGSGSGWVRFTRTAPTVGVDTAVIQVTSPVGGAQVRDVVTALVPRTVTLSPATRERVVAVGAQVNDSFQVVLGGDGAATAMWRAAVSGEGATLTRSEGVGSGWVTFTRSALAEGVQDASVEVTSDGVSASYLDRVTGTIARAVALTPAARSRTVLAGSALRDSVWLAISGTGSNAAAWSATQVGNLALEATSGVGSGWIFYTQTVPEGLTVSELRVTSDGAVAVAVDSVTGTVARALALTPAARSRTALAGSALRDSVWLAISGTGSNTAAWSATQVGNLALEATSGTGSGWIFYTQTVLEGLTVSELRVTSDGAVAVAVDSVRGEVPLGMSIAPTTRSRQMAPNATVLDSVEVRLTGSSAPTTAWSATSSSSRLVPTNATGVGSAWLRFQRSSGPEGVEIARLTVTAGQQVANYHDSVTVLQPETVAVTPSGRVRSISIDATVPVDSFFVTTAGGSGSLTWSVSSDSPALTAAPLSGSGSGWVRYTHTRPTVGESVALVTVTSGAATATFVDTLRRTAIPRTVALSPTGRRVVMVGGESAVVDSISVQLGGTGAATATWHATAAGVEVLTPSGVGSGWLRMRRAAAPTPGLAVGTVSVISDGAAATYVDTVETRAPTQPTGGVQVSPSELATDAGYAIAVKKTLPVQVTIGGADAATIVWRMRRLSGSAGRATVSSVWRTGSLEIGLSVATTTSTMPGTYVDSFVVERQDGKGTARLRHVMTVRAATPETLVFVRPGQVRRFHPADRLVTDLADTVRFVLTPPEGVTSLGWTARVTGALTLPWDGKKGSGLSGSTIARRATVPASLGWTVDSVIIRTMGKDFVYLDSVYVGTDVPPVSGELGFVHPVTSRVHTVYSGGSSFTTYLPTKPVGTGADTLPWRVRIYQADPGHAQTWDPVRVGEVNTRIGIGRKLPAGVHVDTIVTAFIHDQRIQTVILDSLIVLDAPVSRGAAKKLSAGRTTAMPTVTTREDASLVIEGHAEATRSVEAGMAQWDLVLTDAPIGRTVVRVAEVSGDEDPAWRTLTSVRLEALPTRREILGALRGEDALVAAWVDALGDGDGRVTLAEVVRAIRGLDIP
jgi:subtilisin